mgnify:CR=1 FL=1
MSLGGLLIGLFLSCDAKITTDPFAVEFNSVAVHRKSPKGLRFSQRSSVKVTVESKDGMEMGSASGNYFKHKGHYFILTAAHVAERPENTNLMIRESIGIGKAKARVIYMNKDVDLAVLILSEKLSTVEPIRWSRKDRWDIEVGDYLYYTGNPMEMTGLSFEGFVSKVYIDMIAMQGFAWMGSSGSAVFDDRGRVVGVISAIKFDVPGGAFPQLIPSLVLVAPISVLHDGELEAILEANQ